MTKITQFIYVPSVPPAKAFWLNINEIRLIGDLTETEMVLKIWFNNGESLLLCREQANEFLEQFQLAIQPETPSDRIQKVENVLDELVSEFGEIQSYVQEKQIVEQWGHLGTD